MDARTLTRLAFYLLVAALATGCTPLRGSGPAKLIPIADRTAAPVPGADLGVTAAADGISGGTVVAAGGAGQPPMPPSGVPSMQPPAGAAPAPIVPPAPLAQPQPLPPTPAWPAAADPQPGAVVVTPAPFAGAKPLPLNSDPHVRAYPTVTGARLDLGPGEMSTARVVELTLHLERLAAQNNVLAARIRELETGGGTREQALEEAKREIDAVTAEAIKTRSVLQGQVTSLQGKVKELEQEDIVFLRAVIDALGRLVPPEKKP